MDSDSTGSYASDSDDYASSTTSSHDRALQQEWQDQLEQLKLMFQIIIFPFAGKFFGRKFGYFRKLCFVFPKLVSMWLHKERESMEILMPKTSSAVVDWVGVRQCSIGIDSSVRRLARDSGPALRQQ